MARPVAGLSELHYTTCSIAISQETAVCLHSCSKGAKAPSYRITCPLKDTFFQIWRQFIPVRGQTWNELKKMGQFGMILLYLPPPNFGWLNIKCYGQSRTTTNHQSTTMDDQTKGQPWLTMLPFSLSFCQNSVPSGDFDHIMSRWSMLLNLSGSCTIFQPFTTSHCLPLSFLMVI